MDGQVFWLPDLPTLCAFPFRLVTKQWLFADFVPGYSGGTAPDFNGIPYYADSAPDVG
jgi:hypothetical protein